ncbi:hypothetical protein BCR39DRAFT_516819 [Naematelia encephala]|uniref:Copper acquisition factor BIM1-like domain-containing protein n=1 Tax=Naematelia encephala TaxID=71784 RepID=A0A1Y2BI35_9TREE|nr:hypothetical protein BCR39DRAFT_516819 [Naematelia encephala]
MFSFRGLLGASVLVSTAMAHYTLDYPISRGFDDDNEVNFCGGFNSVENPRQPFPLSNGTIHIDSHHTLATVVAYISTSSNPTSFNDFNTTSNGTSIPLLTNFFQVPEGDSCWTVDMAGLNIGLTNGSLVTLQVQFDGGDGNLYQCADLVLLSDFTTPSNETCSSDATTASITSTATSSQAASSTSNTATSAAATQSSGAAVLGVKAGSWLFGMVVGLAGVTVL